MNSIKLDANNELFVSLKNNPPKWWLNLLADKELYFDVRKDNYISVYYNGGSIMKLEFDKKKNNYKAKINSEYIPLNVAEPVDYEFGSDGKINFPRLDVLSLNDFSEDDLSGIKNRIKKINSRTSEGGIQGSYMVNRCDEKNPSGFFIDSEFAWGVGSLRFDMVWVDLTNKTIYMVELKTMGDNRLRNLDQSNADDSSDAKKSENIKEQLEKYHKFAIEHKNDLVNHYNNVYKIKKSLNILPAWVSEKQIDGIEDFNFQVKPILLVGDCTQKWIDDNREIIKSALGDVAFGCIYQGRGTIAFGVPPNKKGKNYCWFE